MVRKNFAKMPTAEMASAKHTKNIRYDCRASFRDEIICRTAVPVKDPGVVKTTKKSAYGQRMRCAIASWVTVERLVRNTQRALVQVAVRAITPKL
mmetsp:Transcript_284/g.683  ORF Transcript_284/g.683 Transcript_284/m.683 type:complete len:95 (-) Transcript_284:322-606(-)